MAVTLRISTEKRNQMVEITDQVAGALSRNGMQSGICVLYVPHTTAGVAINENADPDVVADVTRFLARLIPQHAGFAHVEGNSDSHIKAILTGSSATVLVENNRLLLGRWQGIYFCEFDGPRNREIWVQFIAGQHEGTNHG